MYIFPESKIFLPHIVSRYIPKNTALYKQKVSFRIRPVLVLPELKAGLGFVRNERACLVESSLQSISSNSLLWNGNRLLVVIQT